MSLYENINRRKRLGISRSKKDSTISKENYDNMKRGWKKVKEKKIKKKELTDRQKKSMENHKEHHTAKHMEVMTKEMLGGKTFKKAHTIAMSKVGK